MIRLVQKKLIIPRGDTGSFDLPVQPITNTGDVAVFSIIDPRTRTKVFEKIVNAEGQSITVEFSHNDTVNLPVGRYVWDVKFYLNPMYADGKLVNGDEIDSYYSAYKLPDCDITPTGDQLLTSDDSPSTTLTPESLDILSAAITETHQSRDDAAASERNAAVSEANASDSAATAQGYVAQITGLSAEAIQLRPYEQPTAAYNSSTGILTLGIPKGETGDAFHIVKTYVSIAAMNADYNGTDVDIGEFVMIVSSIEDPDNAKVYVKGNQSYVFVVDMSGATGIQGVSVESIVKTGTAGLVDTYTITYSDGSHSTFTVTNGASIDLHICAQGEYDATTRVPTIQSPDSRTFYLVPNEDSAAPNAYTEWLYADGAWERFGAQVIDLSGYALSADIPVVKGSGVDSVQNKQSDSFTTGVASGNYSIAIGQNVYATGNNSAAFGLSATEASGIGSFATGWGARASGIAAHAEGSGIATGSYSHAEGNTTTASGAYSHAEGQSTSAVGNNTHVEGSGTVANGTASHAEGRLTTTNASAKYSHVEGQGTISAGQSSHVSGEYNVEDNYYDWYYWQANTDYIIGDKVKTLVTSSSREYAIGYICKEAHNSGSVMDMSKWTAHNEKMNFAYIVGNGTEDNARSNAYALDWDGNGHYMGDVYVRVNADSTGGNKVLVAADIAGKQDALTFDSTPTAASTNPVTSGGIKTYVDTAVSNINTMRLHICTAQEYDAETGIPTIQNPDTQTFYLVPGGDSGNLYIEWIYVDNAWERFGSADIDLSGYALKADTVLETTLSRDRKNDTTIGNASIAFGNLVEASGHYSQAVGSGATASGVASHAEGLATTASGTAAHAEGWIAAATGNYSHAEGRDTTASGEYSHAEGLNTTASNNHTHAEGNGTEASGLTAHAEGSATKAQGSYSHVEGRYTIATGEASHVTGSYNVEDTYATWPEWVASTEYEVGDKVKVTTTVDNTTTITGYKCKTANNDASFTISKWITDTAMNYAEIVGNGNNAARSNAYALDWNGNGHFMGDVYVHANADSSGGTKVATVNDIPVQDVQVNGTSVTSNGIASIPVGTNNVYGVAKGREDRGINLVSGVLELRCAPASIIKTGGSSYLPIVASSQHTAVYYGLAKAAGDTTQSSSSNAVGTYTEDAKSKISEMLNGSVSVSGSTPSITAKSGIRYVCGEVSTLAFTLPASGIVDVVFESGSTPTVLTITPPSGVTSVKWADGFDPTSLEANTVYELNIMDGVLGVAGKWS